ncbi:MAG: HD domain-containing protein [Kiritimatiellales bacterium]
MTLETLIKLTQRFLAYTDRYRMDGIFHPMHQLKLEHTVRVAADARTIAAGMNWPEPEQHVAEAVGLLHDIARFPQFLKHRSFADSDTVDHGDLGAETLRSETLLHDLRDELRSLIFCVVQHHNKKNLPHTLTAYEEKHLRLIRDADRLDIFFICWNSIHTGHIHKHPEISMNLDFTGAPSDTVLDQFERGEKIDYRNLKSMADRFVLQLSWMHDLSYDFTKRLVRERGILEKFIEVLPVKTDRLLNCFEKTAVFLAGV